MSVEENFPKSRIHSFLKDITELCKKHEVSIYTDEVTGKSHDKLTTVLDFEGWEKFGELEADPASSSVYWSRIESHIMHEERPMAREFSEIMKGSKKEISWEEQQGIAQPTLHHSTREEKS